MLRHHAALVAALRAHDADAAEAVGRDHAELGRLRIMDTLARDTTGVWDIDLSRP